MTSCSLDNSSIWCVRWDPEGKLLATSTTTGVKLFESTSEKVIFKEKFGRIINDLFSKITYLHSYLLDGWPQCFAMVRP